jgi:hypothetical protein
VARNILAKSVEIVKNQKQKIYNPIAPPVTREAATAHEHK